MSRPLRHSTSWCRRKYYCLQCETPNNCKCSTAEFRFTYSDKLRVPLSTKNKAVFRQFLRDCPQFANMVPDELKPRFIELLRKVKFYNYAINGYEWTNISEKPTGGAQHGT